MASTQVLARKSPKNIVGNGTALQARAAKALLEAVGNNAEVSTGEVLRSVGYSRNLSLTPSRVVESQGFLIELAKLGLTKELVVPALVQDIKDKPQRRAFELSIAGKWLGLDKTETQSNSVNIQHATFIVNPPLPPSNS